MSASIAACSGRSGSVFARGQHFGKVSTTKESVKKRVKERVPKGVQKGSEKGPRMTPKWAQHDPEMAPLWISVTLGWPRWPSSLFLTFTDAILGSILSLFGYQNASKNQSKNDSKKDVEQM